MVVVETPSEGKPSMGKSIRNLSTVRRVGLDLAKRVFQVHAVDAKCEIVVARKLTRGRLVPFFAELAPCVVAMEACASAHPWGRALIELGHEVQFASSSASIWPTSGRSATRTQSGTRTKTVVQ
jgi:hypothetical protein